MDLPDVPTQSYGFGITWQSLQQNPQKLYLFLVFFHYYIKLRATMRLCQRCCDILMKYMFSGGKRFTCLVSTAFVAFLMLVAMVPNTTTPSARVSNIISVDFSQMTSGLNSTTGHLDFNETKISVSGIEGNEHSSRNRFTDNHDKAFERSTWSTLDKLSWQSKNLLKVDLLSGSTSTRSAIQRGDDFTVTNIPITALQANPYLIENRNACHTKWKVKCLFLVKSATSNVAERKSIRDTWARRSVMEKFQFVIVFLLGDANSKKDNLEIQYESQMYADIVQGRFLDTYRNLTLKVVLGLRWTAEHCLHTEAVMVTDDDVFVNQSKLYERLSAQPFRKTSKDIYCQVRPKGTSEINRDRGDKWFVDEKHFQGLVMFPFTYCNGFTTLFSPHLLYKLFNSVYKTPFFWIDDVYLYGMLAEKVPNVMFHDDIVTAYNIHANRCFIGHYCELLSGKADVRHMYLFYNQSHFIT